VRGAARLVGHWGDRRGRIPRQRYYVDSRRLQNREIELNVRSDRILVAARCEIQILSVGRPYGIRIDLTAVSQTGQFFRPQFVQHEVAPAAPRRQTEGEPAPVRRGGLVVD